MRTPDLRYLDPHSLSWAIGITPQRRACHGASARPTVPGTSTPGLPLDLSANAGTFLVSPRFPYWICFARRPARETVCSLADRVVY
jgi:hypothetical protein